MDYRTLYAKTVADLRAKAKNENIKLPAGATKAQIVNILLQVENVRAAEAMTKAAEGQRRAEEELARREQAANEQKTADETAAVKPEKKPAAKKTVKKADAADKSDTVKKTGIAKKGDAAEKNAHGRTVKKKAETPAEPVKAEGSVSTAKAEALAEPVKSEGSGSTAKAEAPAETVKAETPAEPPKTETSAEKPGVLYPFRPAGERTPAARPQENRRPYENSRPQEIRAPEAPANTRLVEPLTNTEEAYRRQSNEPARPEPHFPHRNYIPQDPNRVTQTVSDIISQGDLPVGGGVLELMDGYGVLHAQNCLPGPNDVYVSAAQIRRFNLRPGDLVMGRIRPQREGDRYSAIMFIDAVNGESPDRAIMRPQFEDLIPIYPNERFRIADEKKADMALRVIDMLAPIGKGQRTLIVSQPKAGKTVLLKKIANAITKQYPQVKLIVLLIDERPEEVTDMRRSIDGEIVFSTFDEVPENHCRAADMVLERARRLVEQGRDVVILLDSITRLARAYNLTVPPTGRTLSGGLDPGALHQPKKFFGAARNIEDGGSLTIIATALVETGSRMDDIIYEEFKGTGNSEIFLDRKLSEKRIFPAIDMNRSGTRRDDLLYEPDEQEGALSVRRMLANTGNQDSAEQLLGMLDKSEDNDEFYRKFKILNTVLRKDVPPAKKQ